jgi:hypothetical protein
MGNKKKEEKGEKRTALYVKSHVFNSKTGVEMRPQNKWVKPETEKKVLKKVS